MRSMRVVAALVLKESLQIMRDPSSIFIAFVLPLTLLLLFGYGVTLDLDRVPFGVALEDGGAEARSLAQELAGTTIFDTEVSASRVPLMRRLARGDLKGVLIIPQGFSSALHSRTPARSATAQIVTDGVFPNTASLIANYALRAADRWMTEALGVRSPVQITSRIWYNEEADSRRFIIPALIVVIMTLIGTMLTALVVAREWERGTMEAMLATPMGRVELLVGKLLPYYLLAVLSVFFCVAFSEIFFDMPFRGSYLMLFIVGSAFMLVALSLGLVISNVTKSQYAASIGALMLSFLPAVMLSGGIFEISSMPLLQRTAAAVLPAKYLTTCMLTLFLVGDVPELVLPNAAVLAGMGALGIAAAFLSTARRLG